MVALARSATLKRLPPVVFILGAGRSGTTLLRAMLGGSPALYSLPELNLLLYRRVRAFSFRHALGVYHALRMSQGSRFRAAGTLAALYWRDAEVGDVYAAIQQAIAPRILVDKSPEYGNKLHVFERMEILFDEPRYIWLIRHPVAVMESYLRRGEIMRRHLGDMSPESAWRGVNRRIEDFLSRVPAARHAQLRYEDLVAAPEAAMRRVAEFLSIEYGDGLIRPYDALPERHLGGITSQTLHGDPWFSTHRGIEPELADVWRERMRGKRLDPRTARLARQLGYVDEFTAEEP